MSLVRVENVTHRGILYAVDLRLDGARLVVLAGRPTGCATGACVRCCRSAWPWPRR